MPSRISGACNGCRTKKQKCSGDRSGCSQCATAGIVCTWPEQRKRGPAKGYIEGLEHRLHDAETLLLQLLPLVSTEHLASAAAAAGATQNGVSGDSPDPNNRSSPPVLNKKTGIDYWDRFPLDTVENIRRWQQDCAIHSHFKDDHPTGSGSRPSSLDFSSEQLPSRKPPSMPQYRSMSNDSYRGSQDFGSLSRSNSGFNGVSVQTTSGFDMQSQPAFANSSAWPQQQHHIQTNGLATHQQQQQQHGLHRHSRSQQSHQPQHHSNMNQQMNMTAASGPMDVDHGGAFFSGEVKRHLFW